MSFSCYRCDKSFPKKWRLARHLKRKNICVQKTKNCSKKLKNTQKNSKSAQKNSKEYSCDYCDYKSIRASNLKRHLNTCKKKKTNDNEMLSNLEEKVAIMQTKLLEQEMENNLLKEVSSQQMTNCNNTNNTNITNNTVNITLNDYGQENITYLKHIKYKKFIDKIMGSGMVGLQHYIKYKYCNPQQPENLTIKYTNERSNKLKVRKDNQWKTRDKYEVMDELYDRDNNVDEVLGVYEHMNDLVEEDEMDIKEVNFINKIHKFYNDSENSDDTLVEIDKLKNTTLNDLYDCYKKHKIKFDGN
jgi:hypothetical protein